MRGCPPPAQRRDRLYLFSSWSPRNQTSPSPARSLFPDNPKNAGCMEESLCMCCPLRASSKTSGVGAPTAEGRFCSKWVRNRFINIVPSHRTRPVWPAVAQLLRALDCLGPEVLAGGRVEYRQDTTHCEKALEDKTPNRKKWFCWHDFHKV